MMEVRRLAAQVLIQDKEAILSRITEAVAEDEGERKTKKVKRCTGV